MWLIYLSLIGRVPRIATPNEWGASVCESFEYTPRSSPALGWPTEKSEVSVPGQHWQQWTHNISYLAYIHWIPKMAYFSNIETRLEKQNKTKTKTKTKTTSTLISKTALSFLYLPSPEALAFYCYSVSSSSQLPFTLPNLKNKRARAAVRSQPFKVTT